MRIFYPKDELVGGLDYDEALSGISALWYRHAGSIFLIPLVLAMIPIMNYLDASEWMAWVIAIPMAIIYMAIFTRFLPSYLLRIALDEEWHYLLLVRQSKSYLGRVLRTEYVDIHEIENISEGLIQLKTGKRHKVAQIDSQTASEMNMVINRLIARSGGIAPTIRRKRPVEMDFVEED